MPQLGGILAFGALIVLAGLLFVGCHAFWRQFHDSQVWAVVVLALAVAAGLAAIAYFVREGSPNTGVYASAVAASSLLTAMALLFAKCEFEHKYWVIGLGSFAILAALVGVIVFLAKFAHAREQAPLALGGVVLCALAAATVIKSWSCHVTPGRGDEQLRVFPLQRASDGNPEKTLAVFIHGFGGPARCGAARATLAEYKEGDASFDVLRFQYLGDRFLMNALSNQEPEELTRAMTRAIGDVAEEYDRIFLMGHSLGVLLARKVFLAAHGAASDVLVPPADWGHKVKRIVMLAGINRGMNIDENRPSDMSALKHFGYWVGTYVGDLLGVATLSRATRSGSTFVANLRMDWVRLFRRDAPPEVALVQLLGDIDDLVSESDSADFQVIGNSAPFYPIPVRGTGHGEILDMASKQEMDDHRDRTKRNAHVPDRLDLRVHRRESFKRALGDLRDLPIANPANSTGDRKANGLRDAEVENVLIVLHGIRDLGRWAGSFEERLREELRDRSETWRVVAPRYGYFGMGPFLLRAERGKYVRWLMDEVTDIIARYPKAKFDFFGHSNGTYLLAKSLEQYASLHLRRVVFAGSVVDKDFEFRFAAPPKKNEVPFARNTHVEGELPRVRGTISEIVNLKGSKDWVVALFPSLFEFFFAHRLNPLVGQAGFKGFVGASGAGEPRLENIQIEGGHGAFGDRIDDIVRYFLTDETEGFAERTKTIKSEGTKSWLLGLGASGGQVAIFLVLAISVLAIGTWLVGAAGVYSTPVAILYLLAVGWVLSKL